MKRNTLLMIFSGIIGSAVLVLFFLIFKLNIIFSMIIGGTAFFGIFMLFYKKEMVIVADGITGDQVAQILEEGEKKIKAMNDLIKNISKENVRKEILDIIDITGKIFEDIKKDPKDVKPAKQFLSYHLDATINILTKYMNMSGQSARSAEVTASLEKVENLLETIKKAFSKQLEILMRDDVMDLNTELEVLEKTIKMEGLGE